MKTTLKALALPLVFQATNAYLPMNLDFDTMQANSPETQLLLHEALSTEGLVSVSNVPGLAELKRDVLGAASACVLAQDNNKFELTLNDGTIRRTLAFGEDATSTEFDGSDSSLLDCQRFDTLQMQFRQIVSSATENFATSLDSVLGLDSQLTELLRDESGEEALTSITDIVTEGIKLEHFHTYQKPSPSEEDFALKLHVDQGLFIVIAPAISLSSSGSSRELAAHTNNGFHIELRNGEVVEPLFKDDELVFMIGDGFHQWVNPKLKSGLELRPTPHAMKMPEEAKTRSWYGKMILPKASSFIETKGMNFAKLRAQANSPNSAEAGICSHGMSVAKRVLTEECDAGNGNTGIICWIQCQFQECAADEELLCIQVEGDDRNPAPGEECEDGTHFGSDPPRACELECRAPVVLTGAPSTSFPVTDAPTTHDHDGHTHVPTAHEHNETSAPTTHDHDGHTHVPTAHEHNGTSAPTAHDHDGHTHVPTAHEHNETSAPTAHDHDGHTHVPTAHEYNGTSAPTAHDHDGHTHVPTAHEHNGTSAPTAHDHDGHTHVPTAEDGDAGDDDSNDNEDLIGGVVVLFFLVVVIGCVLRLMCCFKGAKQVKEEEILDVKAKDLI